MNALGIEHADALVVGSDELNDATMEKITSAGVPLISLDDGYLADINAFYDEVWVLNLRRRHDKKSCLVNACSFYDSF